jgi:hypothetical protein
MSLKEALDSFEAFEALDSLDSILAWGSGMLGFDM